MGGRLIDTNWLTDAWLYDFEKNNRVGVTGYIYSFQDVSSIDGPIQFLY